MDSTGGNGPARAGFEPSDFFRSFAGTVRAVILEPARFFRGLDRQRTPGNAVLFAVVCIVINSLLIYAVAPVEAWIRGESYPGMERFDWILLASSVLFSWIVVYLFAALQHFLVMIFVRPRKDYDATLLVYAYASALALLSWVPIVGYLASFYGLYITMLGIREMHRTSTARAFLSVLVPSLLLLASTAWSFWP